MALLYLIGRIVVGGFFLMNGMNHLTKTEMMAGYAASKGVPAPKLAVVATGVQLLVGGLMILLGWYLWVGALILVLFLVPVALVMHNFWTVQDAQTRMVETIQFMKNLAIAGALLMLMAASYTTRWNPLALGQ
jgi:putative oxidoreductase